MSLRHNIYMLLGLFLSLSLSLDAQEDPVMHEKDLETELQELRDKLDSYRAGKSRFLLRGYAHSGLQATEGAVTFEGGSFNPLLIYKQSDNLLFESELELELEGSRVELGLEYANVNYLLSKSVTLRAGKMLTPFGIFVPRLHPAWVNKFPFAPLGAGHHDGIVPTSDIGVEIRGGAYFGAPKVNYSVYVVNGPRLIHDDDDDVGSDAGKLVFGEFPDNNKNKTIGARFGILPFSNSSLELGISGMYGKVGDQDSDYQDISAKIVGFDVTYINKLSFMSSLLDIKGQYARIDVENAAFLQDEDLNLYYDFDNQSETYFAQLALRPAFVESKIIRNVEFVGRYSSIETPKRALWYQNQEQWDIGVNYWLNWRTVFKLSYRITDGEFPSPDGGSEDGHGHGHAEVTGSDYFFIHWAIGF